MLTPLWKKWSTVEDESIAAQELRLNYLSETLAKALQEMEVAQENLKKIRS